MEDQTFQERPKASPKKSTSRESVTILPSSQHTHTIIVLHGRGSNAENFSTQFLASKTSDLRSVKDLFPNVKWVFPTAAKRRACAFNRALVRQWFDIYSLDRQEQRSEVQYEGLRESCVFLHRLINEEVREVGFGQVVLGGLSMGCAVGLWAALSYHDHNDGKNALGGFFGMSGWLPFANDIRDTALLSSTSDNNDFFQNPDFDNKPCSLVDSLSSCRTRVVNLIRDIADLPPLHEHDTSLTHLPIFLGHGLADEKVNFKLGKQAASILDDDLELDVTWKEYEIGHWWKEPDEIDDLVDFLRVKVSIEANAQIEAVCKIK